MRISQFLIAGLALVIVSGCATDRCGSRCNGGRAGVIKRIFAPHTSKPVQSQAATSCGCNYCNASNAQGAVTGQGNEGAQFQIESNCDCEYVPSNQVVQSNVQPTPATSELSYERVSVAEAPPRPSLEAEQQFRSYLESELPKVEPIQQEPIFVANVTPEVQVAPVEPTVDEPIESEFNGALTPAENSFQPIAGNTIAEEESLLQEVENQEFNDILLAPAEVPKKKIKALPVSTSRVLAPAPVEPALPEVFEARPEPMRLMKMQEALEKSKTSLPAKEPVYTGPIVLKAKAYEGSTLRKPTPNVPERFAQRGEQYYQIGSEQVRQTTPEVAPEHFEDLPPINFGTTTERYPTIEELPIMQVPINGESKNEVQLRDLGVRMMPISREVGSSTQQSALFTKAPSGVTEIIRLRAEPTGQSRPQVGSIARFTNRAELIVRGEKSIVDDPVLVEPEVPALAEQIGAIGRLLKSGKSSETIDR